MGEGRKSVAVVDQESTSEVKQGAPAPKRAKLFRFVKNIGFEEPILLKGKEEPIRFSRQKTPEGEMPSFSVFMTEDASLAEAVRAYAKENPTSLIFEQGV